MEITRCFRFRLLVGMNVRNDGCFLWVTLAPTCMARKETTDELLRMFYAASPEFCGMALPSCLRFVKEEKRFYKYEQPIWTPLDRDWTRSRAFRFLQEAKANGTIHDGTNITAQMTHQIVDLMETDFPDECLLETTKSPWVATLSGALYNLETGDKDTNNAPLIGRHAFLKIPCAIEEIENTPEPVLFLKFLRSILVQKDNPKEPDFDLICFVQEMMGYLLLDSTQAEAAFFFIGSGSNGKSKLLDVIEAMIGDAHISRCTLENMTTNRFASSGLVGKRLNLIRDDESERIKSDVLKTLISGEKLDAEQKYEKSFSFIPRCRCLISSNNVTTFKTIGHGLLRRLYFVPFHRRFVDAEIDPNIVAPMLKEIHLITAWAIQGLKRLLARKTMFVRTQAMLDQAREFESEQSNALDFFYSTFQKTDDLDEGFAWSDIYTSYVAWCLSEGRKPKGKILFIKEIKDKQNDRTRFIDEAWWHKRKAKTIRGFRGYELTEDQGAWIHSGYANIDNL